MIPRGNAGRKKFCLKRLGIPLWDALSKHSPGDMWTDPECIGGPALEGLHLSWALRGSLPGFGQLELVQPLGGLVTEDTGDTTAHRTSWDPRLS